MEKILVNRPPRHFTLEKDALEHKAWQSGSYVCGIDEVGRGCLAGPVVAVAALLPPFCQHPLLIDSKALSEAQRTTVYQWLQGKALWSAGVISPDIVDSINIYRATQKAMRKAFYGLVYQLGTRDTQLQSVAIDAMPLTLAGYHRLEVHAYPKGESWSSSVAAASILAKVTRDTLMVGAAANFPSYAFQSHKGYGTTVHQAALQTHGISLLHRRSFLKNYLCQETEHAYIQKGLFS